MGKFKLNGAGIIEHARLAYVVEHSGALTDNRFAVINGLMFELMTVEVSKQGATSSNVDEGYSCSVCVYDADGCYNPSHGSDISAAYGRFIVGFEFYVSAKLCDENNEFCIDAESNCEALFLHLIEHALKDSLNTSARLRNFARGLDLDHIQTVGHSVDQGESAHLGESVTDRFAFAPCGLTSTGLAIVEAHPVDGESWSSDFALAVFEVNTQNSHYAQTKGEPVTLTGDEVSNLLQVAGEAS